MVSGPVAPSSGTRTFRALRGEGSRFWFAALGWSAAFAGATGIPTVLIANSFFNRMTPVSPWQYAFWIASSVLAGLVVASRKSAASACSLEGRVASGGGLTYLAVGCPICNKIVVAIVGISGALRYFAPVQPILGAAALGILAATLHKSLTVSARGAARVVPGDQFWRRQTSNESGPEGDPTPERSDLLEAP